MILSMWSIPDLGLIVKSLTSYFEIKFLLSLSFSKTLTRISKSVKYMQNRCHRGILLNLSDNLEPDGESVGSDSSGSNSSKNYFNDNSINLDCQEFKLKIFHLSLFS